MRLAIRGVAVLGLIALCVVAAIVVPLAAIWSLNILFALGIPYTTETWLAVLILLGILCLEVG